jgi:pyruvate dehydrogenase E2 component (dihydrolipoamide acetyltransferase)
VHSDFTDVRGAEMAVRVLMPTFGLTEGEATIVRWRKQVGESVQADEPLFEAESEKASLEVPTPQEGVLLHVLVAEGEIVPYGGLVAWIGRAGEKVIEDGANEQVAADAGSPEKDILQGVALESPAQASVQESERRVNASPIAKRMAREHEIALNTLQGSGPGGRIVEADIRRALKTRDEVVKAVPTPPGTNPQVTNGDLMPFTALRRVTAERLSASARETVAVPLFITVDMSEIQRLRERTRAEYEQRFGVACSYNALIIRACALALPAYPALNGQWTGEGVRVGRDVNIGLAVAVEDGLLVPVIQQAQLKRLAEIQAELHTMVELARARNVPPQKLSNGTFTVTNLGHVGIDAFVPTINLPQTAILGVGRVAEQMVVVGGQAAVRPMATLCLVFDHRATDGVPAASCLARIKELLENPYLLA